MGEMNLLQALKTKSFLVSDGATGTYLQSNGLEPGACPEELNVTKPELIVKMAEDYFNNGADVVLTNSFGANPFMLSKYGLRNSGRQLRDFLKSVYPEQCDFLGSGP